MYIRRYIRGRKSRSVEEFQSISPRFHFRVMPDAKYFRYMYTLAMRMCNNCRMERLSVHTYIQGILIRIEDEPGVDDLSGQRENVEGSMDQVVPAPGDVQAAQLFVASRLVLDWKIIISRNVIFFTCILLEFHPASARSVLLARNFHTHNKFSSLYINEF